MFRGGLKEYQLKGLRWLDNLHEQAINGILADEMGLGKTVEAIAFLAHLAENKGNWGPFLIIAPSTTLYNWQQEFQKFTPELRVLPYWGSLSERKTLRKFFNSKQLYTPSSPFHVLVTSYQLVVADDKSFRRIIWQYMILDEAQAIKNINSQRWKKLLGFNCRNRLLMTGTPIQNSMAELWALLHFIMPKLFDNHKQFQDWFSKDIEAHSQNAKEVNTRQLSRLHAVLKPFMLRRVKKDVEHEIGPKEEVDMFCQMSSRQKILYSHIKEHLSNITDLFSLVDSKAKMENLMNIAMQLRKVCNHPELFERRVGRTPLLWKEPGSYKSAYMGFNEIPGLTYNLKNPIQWAAPKMIVDEIILNDDFIGRKGCNWRGILSEDLLNAFKPSKKHPSLSILHLLGFSVSEMAQLLESKCPLLLYILMLHYMERMKCRRRYEEHIHEEIPISDSEDSTKHSRNGGVMVLSEAELRKRAIHQTMLTRKNPRINFMGLGQKQVLDCLTSTPDGLISDPLIQESPIDIKYALRYIICRSSIYVPKALATPVHILAHSSPYDHYSANNCQSDILRQFLYGSSMYSPYSPYKGKLTFPTTNLLPETPFFPNSSPGLIPPLISHFEGSLSFEVPNFEKLVSDCGKLRVLDDLLRTLKLNNHRCLVFCQMTKMLDILEDYLSWRKYPYFRMDGSSSIADRRDMVSEFQSNPEIFCFLLSTRAGGLGVTLTAADTVIFYDNDWNPTMDAQAADRAHRIGQTKKVTIYRLITKNTVEERIVKRAKQKQNVQATVYSGGVFKGDVFKPKEVIDLLLDDDDRKKRKDIIRVRKERKQRERAEQKMESGDDSGIEIEAEDSGDGIEVNPEAYEN